MSLRLKLAKVVVGIKSYIRLRAPTIQIKSNRIVDQIKCIVVIDK